MNRNLKFYLYGLLVLAALWFGLRFYSSYRQATEHAGAPEEIEAAATLPAPDAAGTNQGVPPPDISPDTSTNPPVAATPELTATNAPDGTAPPRSRSRVSMMANLGAFIAAIIILGLLLAHDATQFFGNRAVDFLFDEEGKTSRDPVYDEAEHVWANGKHLEAIEMMRTFYKKNPRDLYVPLRIAEIYEKDLKNHLAAALEYEELLQFKLPPEKWGWAAIHLCNLYTRLGKIEQSLALLHRVVNEYGETPAAEKARKRLAQWKEVNTAMSDTGEVELPPDPDLPPPPPPPPPAPSKPSLPPGFRPRK